MNKKLFRDNSFTFAGKDSSLSFLYPFRVHVHCIHIITAYHLGIQFHYFKLNSLPNCFMIGEALKIALSPWICNCKNMKTAQHWQGIATGKRLLSLKRKSMVSKIDSLHADMTITDQLGVQFAYFKPKSLPNSFILGEAFDVPLAIL